MFNIRTVLRQEIGVFLPDYLRRLLELIDSRLLENVLELRLRAGNPVVAVTNERDYIFAADGKTTHDASAAVRCDVLDIGRIIQAVSKNSLYAFEQELRAGFMTAPGGHRIGFTGQAVMEAGRLKTISNIGSINIRLARDVVDCAAPLLPYIIGRRRINSCLIIGPPRCGKTTLLKDIIRKLSLSEHNKRGWQIGVIDERSELAACRRGVSSLDIGYRVDVLSGCPKAVGIMMLIRTMAPAVIITDEIGQSEDGSALAEALRSGVAIISSVHGESLNDVRERFAGGGLLMANYFDYYIVLTDRPRMGTVREVIAGSAEQAREGG